MFSRIIADDPSRKNVYVEIYYKNVLFAEVINENDKNEIMLYRHHEGCWEPMPLAGFIEVLNKANEDMVFV